MSPAPTPAASVPSVCHAVPLAPRRTSSTIAHATPASSSAPRRTSPSPPPAASAPAAAAATAAVAAAAADMVALLEPSVQMNLVKVLQRLKLEDDHVVALYVFGSRLWGYVRFYERFCVAYP
jgi:hypothetical protein